MTRDNDDAIKRAEYAEEMLEAFRAVSAATMRGMQALETMTGVERDRDGAERYAERIEIRMQELSNDFGDAVDELASLIQQYAVLTASADALANAVWPHDVPMLPPNGTPEVRDALQKYQDVRRSQ